MYRINKALILFNVQYAVASLKTYQRNKIIKAIKEGDEFVA